MSRYTINTRNYHAILKANLRKGLRQFPELDRRMLFEVQDIPHNLLNETVVRLFWNDFNSLSRFPHDKWDDAAAIAQWFDGYDMERVNILPDGETVIADSLSERLFELVIDPTLCHIHDNIYDQNIRGNWEWEEHKVIDVRNDYLIMENLGDFRIRDWERMKDRYEGDNTGRGHDIYRMFSSHTH